MKKALSYFEKTLDEIRQSGTSKDERVLTTPQGARISTRTARDVLNMCANNYLGLSGNQELIKAAKASYDEWGFGLSSVRFICGTQDIHKQLEHRIAGNLFFSKNLFQSILYPRMSLIKNICNKISKKYKI